MDRAAKNAYMRQWAARNPEKVKAFARKTYEKTRQKRLLGIASRYQSDPEYREYVKRKAREWRVAHPGRKRDNDAGRRGIAKRFIREYLATHPCIDCGESCIDCLDFDHRDPKKKRYCIGAGVASGILPESLLEEIEKCDVRCCNCHRKKHAREGTQGKRIHA